MGVNVALSYVPSQCVLELGAWQYILSVCTVSPRLRSWRALIRDVMGVFLDLLEPSMQALFWLNTNQTCCCCCFCCVCGRCDESGSVEVASRLKWKHLKRLALFCSFVLFSRGVNVVVVFNSRQERAVLCQKSEQQTARVTLF